MQTTSPSTTTRLVVSGHISPRCMAIHVDPTFGTQDEWHATMQNAVDATPETMDFAEDTLDYESYMEDVTWMRQGC